MPSSSSSIVTLVTAPPAFGLPSLSLESTAVETILKLGKIEHIVDRQQQHQQKQNQTGDDNNSSSYYHIPVNVRDSAIRTEGSVYHDNNSASSSSSTMIATHHRSSNAPIASTSAVLLENADFLPTPIVYDANNNNSSSSSSCWPPHLAASHAATVSRLDEALNDDESAATQAVTEMIRSSLFPALEFLWLVDDGDFNTHVAKVWERRSNSSSDAADTDDNTNNDNEQENSNNNNNNSGRSFWERLLRPLSSMRQQRISRLKSIGRFANADDAFVALEKGFSTIEKYLAAARRRAPTMVDTENNSNNKSNNINNDTHSSTEDTSSSSTSPPSAFIKNITPQYFFGRHNQPSSIDGFVFAATSAIVFGQFTESSPLRAFQTQAVFTTSTSNTTSADHNSDGKSSATKGDLDSLTTTLRLPLCRKYAESLSTYFRKISSSSVGTFAKYFIDVNDLASKRERERLAMKKRREIAEANDPFAEGRQETLIAIGATLVAYVILANWKSIRKM